MNYISTRDKKISVSAAEAIVMGLSPEGGLYVPSELPSVTMEDVLRLSKLSYCQRAFDILKLFLPDFSEREILDSVENAYNKTNFETDSIAPVYKMTEGTYFLELWHGPTCAFKDMALQILPYLLTKSISKLKIDKTVVILVATSGDTGKAALDGFCDVSGTKIIVFYPEKGVSEIQRLQMVTQDGDNVFVSAVEGNFDDAQTGVKNIFTDNAYKEMLNEKGYMLSSANSINWGRLLPQIVYYFSAYCDLLKGEEITIGEPVNFVVPTGNFGNILASYYAKKMGLPINKLICASNENNVLTDFIKTGTYNANRSLILTTSPSMDILVSSNLERLLFDLIGCDSHRINEMMNELKTNGKYKIHDITKQKLNELFWAGYASEDATRAAISDTQKEYSYVMDTHTAVAKNVYDQYINETGDSTKTVIVSTASPYKFSHSVLSAIVEDKALLERDEFALLELLSEKSGLKVPTSLSQLRGKEIRFNEKTTKQDMKRILEQAL